MKTLPDSSVSVGVLDKELMEKELDCKFKCFVCRNPEAWLVQRWVFFYIKTSYRSEYWSSSLTLGALLACCVKEHLLNPERKTPPQIIKMTLALNGVELAFLCESVSCYPA